MKMSQLKMVIREVVREEIRLGLKEILGGVKKQPVQKPKQTQNYSKNPILNEVLNETKSEEWELMGETEYTSDRMGEIMGNDYSNLMDNNPETPVTVDGHQPDFLKKDYRAVMKAIDKKKR